MSNEPNLMRSNSTGAVTKVLPEFVQIYIESGWVFINDGTNEGVGMQNE